MSRNLISISVFDKCGYSFVFKNGKLDVCFNSGNLCDGLYMLSVKEISVNFVVGTERNRKDASSSMLWYKHSGNIYRPRIKRLIKQGILPNLDFYDFETCVDRLKEKFTAKTMNTKANKCEDMLQLIHTNMCEPITPNVIGGYKYFITFIYEFSIFGWI